MKEVTNNERLMTVKEVAEALGVSEDTILRASNTLFDQSALLRIGTKAGGKPQIRLTEEQVTAIKCHIQKHHNLNPDNRVNQVITDLEAAAMLLKSAEHFKSRFEQEQQARIEAERRLAIAEPKAAFTNLTMQSHDALYLNDAAKVLKRGYFKVDEKPLLIGDAIQIKRVTKVTQKGLAWLAQTVAPRQAKAERTEGGGA